MATFSKLGDRKEGQDDRARSLPFGLYWSVCCFLIAAWTDCHRMRPWGEHIPIRFAMLAAIHADDRQWAVRSSFGAGWHLALQAAEGGGQCCSKPSWEKFSFPPFPKPDMVPTVACLFQEWCRWQIRSSKSSSCPLRRGWCSRSLAKAWVHTRLAWHSPSLHSWGNQCIDCACRCRGPLSEARLHAHGLYGVLLVFAPGQSPDRNVRHLSGREMAVLTGFAKSDGWRTMDGPPMVSHCRCWSSSVTIQAAWIFTAVFNHLINNGFCAGDKIPPKQILGCVAMYLFKLRDEWFCPERTLAMEMFQEALEKFLDPGPPPSLPAQADSTFQDTTASQGEAIANNMPILKRRYLNIRSVRKHGLQAFTEPFWW